MSYTEREILELLESGKKPSEVAKMFGIKPSTMTTRTDRYRQRGILLEDKRTVNWARFEEWERTKGKHKPKSKPIGKPTSKPESKPTSKPIGKPPVNQESKPAPIGSKPEVYLFSKLEGLFPELEEIVSWWKTRKEGESKPRGKPGSKPKTKRQTYILEEELIESIQSYAEQRGITITEAANEIIRKGLAE